MVLFNYNGTMAMESRWLWKDGIDIITEYDYYYYKKKITILKRSAPNCPAIISYDSLPFNIKNKVNKKLRALGELPALSSKEAAPKEQPQPCFFETYIKPDAAAMAFYSDRFAGDFKKINKYYMNAIILNAAEQLIMERYADRKSRQATGRKDAGLISSIITDIKAISEIKDTNGNAKYPHTLPLSVRNFRPLLNEYIKNGYTAIIHKNEKNDNARKVGDRLENLLLAIWRMEDKPFVDYVHEKNMRFISGDISIYNTATGEKYEPSEFQYKDRPINISKATVWKYLKDVINNTATFADRNGNFDYYINKRPKHERKNGQYSLSKVSADDSALSRKSVLGWVARYHAVDVVSGYWFRPVYVVGGKPTIKTVEEMYRNMFCELDSLGMKIPGQMDVENHLMKNIAWLNEVFPFVYFNPSPTSKRAEHSIKAEKYGIAKQNNHTRGRWYARHEAYRSIRNKVKGDFVEPEYQPQTIVADDLLDVEQHNNSLHPNQNKYRGMTRRDVFLNNVNPNLATIDRSVLWKFIGNFDECTIYNNDYVMAGNTKFNLSNFGDLTKLRPNNYKVTAYWLPEENGELKEAYIYQDDTFIGKAYNRLIYAYNECTVEWTDEDVANKLHQDKRVSKFDKLIRQRRADIPKIDTRRESEEQAIEEMITSNERYIVSAQEFNTNIDIDELIAEYSGEAYREMAFETA